MIQVVPKVEQPHQRLHGSPCRPLVRAGDSELTTDPSGAKMSHGEDDKVTMRNNDRPLGLRLSEQPADVGCGEGRLMGSDREGIDGRLGRWGQDE
jgi:hypothetical protein